MPRWKVKEKGERYLKTKIIAILMLILASTVSLFFSDFHYLAVVLWLIIILAGGYAIFEFEIFVSKVLIVASSLVMEFLVLEGSPDLLTLGSVGNVMLITFGVLDAVLIYSLLKLS
jgi:hypothetical protein